MKTKRRLLSLLLCGALLFSLCSPSAFAEAQTAQDSGQAAAAGGLCEHHTEHDSECGYTEGEPGTPCTHEHTPDCFTEVTECVHEHNGDCYPQESVSGNDATPADAEERKPVNCPHVCSKESGCITEKLNCKHEHNEDCGYSPATEGTPCGFVCEICGAETVTVASVQAMIDALPEKITEDNAGDVKARLEAIDKAKAELSDGELDGLDFSRYMEAVDALAVLDGQAENNLPMPVAGDTGDFTVTGGQKDLDYSYGGGTLTIKTNVPLKISGTGSPTTDKIVIEDKVTANITLENVNIDVSSTQRVCAFEVAGEAACFLTLKGENVLKSGFQYAGLQAAGKASLTITEASTGSLEAQGGNRGAGIGSGQFGTGGIITINGGTVIATGGGNSAGIGGGEFGTGGTIRITGGTVSATGGSLAAGIGGGSDGAGGDITITGGTVTATGNGDGAGIGGGDNGAKGTFSTTENGTAFITAKPEISDTDNQSKWSGVIFEGDNGTVYGDQTLREDFEIESGKTLTIPEGSKLTVPGDKTFTNSGKLIIDGTLEGEVVNKGEISGTGRANPKINQLPPAEGEGYSIDYATKKITIYEGYEVENLTTGVTVEPGTLIKCRKKETTLFNQSKYQEKFTTPAIRNAPTVSINYDWESLNVTERGDVECSLNGTDWQAFGWSGFDDFGWNDGANEIKVYVRLKATGSDYASNPTGQITIPARPAAPDVKGVAPTSTANNDGKITGTAPGMEWEKGWDEGDCTGNEITGLAPGTYTVRVGVTDKSFASEEVNVVVPRYEDATKYPVTVNNGKGDYTEAAEGWTVTVTADNPPDGQQFTGWTVTPSTVTVPDTSTASFTMPGEEVTLTANFEKKSTTHHVTVQNDGNGTASASPASAKAGTKITLSTTANNGYHFQKWEVISNNVTINSDNSFTMPDANVTVKAIFEKDSDPPQPTKYSVTVQTEGSGNASASPASAIAGTKITLSATASSGYHFQKWQVISGGVTINSDNSFTMPAANVTAKRCLKRTVVLHRHSRRNTP